MRVEAGITELCDLLCQKLHTVGRVAENDGLVDLELIWVKKRYQGDEVRFVSSCRSAIIEKNAKNA